VLDGLETLCAERQVSLAVVPVAAESVGRAFDEVVHAEREPLRQLWSGYSPAQQNVPRAAAAGSESLSPLRGCGIFAGPSPRGKFAEPLEASGHVVARLLQELPTALQPNESLVDRARVRVLDGYYSPTRHPNGHPAGAPFEHFGVLQSEQAISDAGEIIDFARTALA
jgi:hypothetical protein